LSVVVSTILFTWLMGRPGRTFVPISAIPVSFEAA